MGASRTNVKSKKLNKKNNQKENQNSALEDKKVKETGSEEMVLSETKNDHNKISEEQIKNEEEIVEKSKTGENLSYDPQNKKEESQSNPKSDAKNKKDRIVYSDHIFMIPLEMDAGFKLSDAWKEEFIDDEIIPRKGDESYIGKEFKRRYMLMRYFNDDAKQSILNIKNNSNGSQNGSNQTNTQNKEPIVSNYHFGPLRKLQEETGKNGIYNIELERPKNLSGGVKEWPPYELEITNIRLRIYTDENTKRDLYLLMIYTENTEYPKLDDMKKINQYGRRVFTPWMPHATEVEEEEDKKESNNLDITVDYTECAKSLSITVGDLRLKQDNELNYLDFWKKSP